MVWKWFESGLGLEHFWNVLKPQNTFYQLPGTQTIFNWVKQVSNHFQEGHAIFKSAKPLSEGPRHFQIGQTTFRRATPFSNRPNHFQEGHACFKSAKPLSGGPRHFQIGQTTFRRATPFPDRPNHFQEGHAIFKSAKPLSGGPRHFQNGSNHFQKGHAIFKMCQTTFKRFTPFSIESGLGWLKVVWCSWRRFELLYIGMKCKTIDESKNDWNMHQTSIRGGGGERRVRFF